MDAKRRDEEARRYLSDTLGFHHVYELRILAECINFSLDYAIKSFFFHFLSKSNMKVSFDAKLV